MGIDWVTIHRVRFPAPVALAERGFPGPDGAEDWQFGPDSPLGDTGFRTLVSDVWGGMAFHPDRAAAEAVLADPGAALPWLAETAEAWTGLVRIIAHRGEVNWPTRFTGRADEDPGGTLVVVTSAGYDPLEGEALEADLPRRKAFLANVEKVRAFYSGYHGNLARSVFNFGARNAASGPIRDGMTLTLWASDAHMQEAAYHPGQHRTSLDWYKAEHSADRTSFTRGRLMGQAGTWDGRPPV